MPVMRPARLAPPAAAVHARSRRGSRGPGPTQARPLCGDTGARRGPRGGAGRGRTRGPPPCSNAHLVRRSRGPPARRSFAVLFLSAAMTPSCLSCEIQTEITGAGQRAGRRVLVTPGEGNHEPCCPRLFLVVTCSQLWRHSGGWDKQRLLVRQMIPSSGPASFCATTTPIACHNPSILTAV